MHEWIAAIQQAIAEFQEREKSQNALEAQEGAAQQTTAAESATAADPGLASGSGGHAEQPERLLRTREAEALDDDVLVPQPADGERAGAMRGSRPRLNYHVEELPEPELDVSNARSNWSYLDEHSMSADEWNKLKADNSEPATISPSLAAALLPMGGASGTSLDTRDGHASAGDSGSCWPLSSLKLSFFHLLDVSVAVSPGILSLTRPLPLLSPQQSRSASKRRRRSFGSSACPRPARTARTVSRRVS
jgi:hypothetical protein